MSKIITIVVLWNPYSDRPYSLVKSGDSIQLIVDKASNESNDESIKKTYLLCKKKKKKDLLNSPFATFLTQ